MGKRVEKKGNRWVGPVCRVANDALDEKDGIHDDRVAQEAGFRGGLVAGTNHLELFPLLVREAFGDRWFEQGSLSIYFRAPTTHLEPVQAVVAEQGGGDPKALQTEAWIQRPDGKRIGEGTLAVGEPGEPTALGSRERRRYSAGDYRLLMDVEEGDRFPEMEIRVTGEDMRRRVHLQEAPLDWWDAPSPWGPAVVSPALCVDRMYKPAETYAKQRRGIRAVPLFGAIEIRHLNGPVLVGATYRAGGRVVARGNSPRTEYFWYEAFLDRADGTRVAAMLMQLRFLLPGQESP